MREQRRNEEKESGYPSKKAEAFSKRMQKSVHPIALRFTGFWLSTDPFQDPASDTQQDDDEERRKEAKDQFCWGNLEKEIALTPGTEHLTEERAKAVDSDRERPADPFDQG